MLEAAVAVGLVDDDADAFVIYADDGGFIGVAAFDKTAQAVPQARVHLAQILPVVGVYVQGMVPS